MDLEKHISLTSSNTIKQIVKPLLEALDVGYFAFHRIYQYGEIVRLSTYPEWSRHYISQNYFDKVKLDYSPSLNYDFEYHLWDYYLNYDAGALPVIMASYNDFHLSCGFTIVRQYEAFLDQYILAATENDQKVDNSTYLRTIQFIENL